MILLIQVRNIVVAALVVASLAGCVAYGGHGGAPYHGRYPASSVNIPEGHMPPPGECRIWYPDRPPGQQPPPGDCRELQHHVPPGAILVHG